MFLLGIYIFLLSSCSPIFNNFNFFCNVWVLNGIILPFYFAFHWLCKRYSSSHMVFDACVSSPLIACSHVFLSCFTKPLACCGPAVFSTLCLQGLCIFCTISLRRFQIHFASFWFVSSHYGVLIKVKFIETMAYIFVLQLRMISLLQVPELIFKV